MDMNVATNNEQIRKIEDIIDIQKANGNFSLRQVAFSLPTEPESAVAANIARSLESGLSKTKSGSLEKKKLKKLRSKRHKSPTADVVSWPSDSDITVLRMKLTLTSSDLKDKVGNLIPGDGLHQPDSSSMVNLATLMRQSQPPSKHSIIEEYLLPLTSWEPGQEHAENKMAVMEAKLPEIHLNELNPGYAVSSRQHNTENLFHDDEQMFSETSAKSKIARFLRLYFCPCCSCLYKMENVSDDHSTYWEKRKGQMFQ